MFHEILSLLQSIVMDLSNVMFSKSSFKFIVTFVIEKFIAM